MKRGTYVMLPLFMIHRDPLNWGDDAEEFDPDRFTDDLREEGRWIPFSGGPRNCVGYVSLCALGFLIFCLPALEARRQSAPSPFSTV